MNNPGTPPPSQQPTATVAVLDAQTIPSQQRKMTMARGIQPGFKILIGLTVLAAVLLLPFAFSDHYLDALRTHSVDLHQLLRGELYKQFTGFVALAFVVLELLLTLRKRGRGWIVRIKLPGSMLLWRCIHIFAGVGLLAVVLVHTLGANGLNFNAVFLWVFFAVTLTALVGVVAETGILESTRSYFGRIPGSRAVLTKGPLIRGMRAIWLFSHIFFVCIFGVMLVMHIALAYYFQ
jgi:hypothetical protein